MSVPNKGDIQDIQYHKRKGWDTLKIPLKVLQGIKSCLNRPQLTQITNNVTNVILSQEILLCPIQKLWWFLLCNFAFNQQFLFSPNDYYNMHTHISITIVSGL